LSIFTKIILMKNWIPAVFFLTLFSCQTAKIKNETYKTATSTVELGAIGQTDGFIINKAFTSKAYPKLENKIRLDVQIVPFTKKLNKTYISRQKYNQSQAKITYVDSLDVKPELAVLSILDISGYISELNTADNEEAFRFIKNTKKGTAVSSIAIALNTADIAKIRQADAYYLVNRQDKKYNLALFKLGKQTELLDLDPTVIIAYQLAYFCWAENKKGQWVIADMNKNHSCKGNTYQNIREDKEQNLFKM